MNGHLFKYIKLKGSQVVYIWLMIFFKSYFKMRSQMHTKHFRREPKVNSENLTLSDLLR